MLHEILLSLSGHPSALLETVKQQQRLGDDYQNQDTLFSLSLPERELLVSIAHIADIHSRLAARTKAISKSHKSTVCRAVATAINSQHLSRFQDHVLKVEKNILTKDSKSVGAYDIVPLASIVAEFEQWTRRLEWLWETAQFMNCGDGRHTANSNRQQQCSSAQIINRLRENLQTGYPDIEETAIELTKAAEAAWLRQLSTWILYGRLPQYSDEDFCIGRQDLSGSPVPEFNILPELLPKFVTMATSASILFIGRSLNQIRAYGQIAEIHTPVLGAAPELKLLPRHLLLLSEVESPVSTAQLSRVISSIRLSLSQNTLQELLPLPKIIQYLGLLQQFFLLGRGEFASTLIAEADNKSFTSDANALRNRRTRRDVGSVIPKEGEINAILARTWSTLSSAVDEDGLDEDLELARELLRLRPPVSPRVSGALSDQVPSRPRINGDVFKNVLFSVPCVLTMQIPAPFDIFLTESDLDAYTDINAYLIALRRAQLRLASLWKHTTLRRDHPAPLGPPSSNSPYGQKVLRIRRERGRQRSLEMRKVWATCGAAVFLVSEITSYFENEIVQGSWQHFRSWMTRGSESRPSSSSSFQPASTMVNAMSSRPTSIEQELASSFSVQVSITSGPAQRASPHDPETIATAHRKFLATLVYSLLLDDIRFTSEARVLIAHIDGLIAYIIRLQTIQQNLDLETDEGVVDVLTDYAKEERETLLEVDRSRKNLDGSMKSVVGRLRELDGERMGSRSMRTIEEMDGAAEGFLYESWRGGGIDRLLMKLDFGRGIVEDEDI